MRLLNIFFSHHHNDLIEQSSMVSGVKPRGEKNLFFFWLFSQVFQAEFFRMVHVPVLSPEGDLQVGRKRVFR